MVLNGYYEDILGISWDTSLSAQTSSNRRSCVRFTPRRLTWQASPIVETLSEPWIFGKTSELTYDIDLWRCTEISCSNNIVTIYLDYIIYIIWVWSENGVPQWIFGTHWHILTYIEIYWNILKYIDIYWHILTYIDIYWHIFTYIYIYWHVASCFGNGCGLLLNSPSRMSYKLYIYTYIHTYIHTHTHMYIYIYTYIHIINGLTTAPKGQVLLTWMEPCPLHSFLSISRFQSGRSKGWDHPFDQSRRESNGRWTVSCAKMLIAVFFLQDLCHCVQAIHGKLSWDELVLSGLKLHGHCLGVLILDHFI